MSSPGQENYAVGLCKPYKSALLIYIIPIYIKLESTPNIFD